tara:strand:- start:319 stop:732 length:414 start_codon:yes stop_codon:yes gene_type:complete
MTVKKSSKVLLILLLSYVLLVVLFELSLGYFQPENTSTLQISTLDGEGKLSPRIVVRIESVGRLYVAANHWPRSWFSDALANPSVQVASEAEQGRYLAVPIHGAEHDRVNEDNSLGLMFRILTGFPPRYFLRLDRAD